MKHRTLIIVAGLQGCGKSTLCDSLAKQFHCQVLHASKLFRELNHLDEKTTGWWEKAGLKFIQQRSRNTKMDEQLDEIILSTIQEGNWVVDSWTMPCLSREGIKVWLKASDEERSKRIAQRDNISPKEALEKIRARMQNEQRIYKKLYGFTFGEDLGPFHLVLDNTRLKPKETLDIVHHAVNVLLKAKP